MTIREMAEDFVEATKIFKDFFGKEPDMNDMSDVMELIAIAGDVRYARCKN